jgi:hypothetical protein
VTPTASTPAAAAAGQRWQQQQQYETPTGRQQQQQRGRSSGEDSTGELYSSLIHSNIHGMDRRAPEAGTGELDGGSNWVLCAVGFHMDSPSCLKQLMFFDM